MTIKRATPAITLKMITNDKLDEEVDTELSAVVIVSEVTGSVVTTSRWKEGKKVLKLASLRKMINDMHTIIHNNNCKILL